MEERLKVLFPSGGPITHNEFETAITIHGTDSLRPNVHVARPVVRFFLVDRSTGEVLQRQNVEQRDESSKSDPPKPSVDKPFEQFAQQHIAGITGPYKLKDSSDFACHWEEQLHLHESYLATVLRDSNDTLLLLEVLEYVRMPVPGWFPIAWAFFSPVSQATGHANTEKMVRLQLYRFSKKFKFIHILADAANAPSPTPTEWPQHLFSRWVKGKRKKYPASLFITVSGVDVSTHPDRLLAASQRMEAEHTKPPEDPLQKHEVIHAPESGPRGCFMLRFSPDGRFLAAACADLVLFPIKLFDSTVAAPTPPPPPASASQPVSNQHVDPTPGGSYDLVHTYHGHHDLIYDMAWSTDSVFLVTASSDGTCKAWQTPARIPPKSEDGAEPPEVEVESTCRFSLQHPCFVYAVAFHPSATEPRVVATGGFDTVIRLWALEAQQLVWQLEGHHANINALVFDPLGTRLYSADGAGVLQTWSGNIADGRLLYEHLHTNEDFKGNPINCLQLHPVAGRALLVHSRHVALLSELDIRFGQVRQRFAGFINREWPVRSAYSPDGRWIVSGSEDGQVYLWEEATGKQAALYPLGYIEPVMAVAFHPFESPAVIAACSFGINQPISVFKVPALDLEVRPPEPVRPPVVFPPPALMNQEMDATNNPNEGQPALDVPVPEFAAVRSTQEVADLIATLPSPPPAPFGASQLPIPFEPSKPLHLPTPDDSLPPSPRALRSFAGSLFNQSAGALRRTGFSSVLGIEDVQRKEQLRRKFRREAVVTQAHNARRQQQAQSKPQT